MVKDGWRNVQICARNGIILLNDVSANIITV